MRVLFLPSWYPDKDNTVSGIFCKKQAEAISKVVDVSVLYIKPCDSLEKFSIDIFSVENGIKVNRVYFRKNKIKFIGKIYNLLVLLFLGLKYYKKLSQKGKFDIVHVNEVNPMGFIALLLKYVCKIPYILTLHWSGYSKRDGSFFRMGIFKIFLFKLVFDNSDEVVTVSKFLKQEINKISTKVSISVIPNVIEENKRGIIENNSFKKKNKFDILHVSLLDDLQKNVSGLIHVFSKLNNYDNLILNIVGSGKDEDLLKQLANKLNLLNRKIFFHGLIPHDKIFQFYEDADIFICNSNFETFSVVCAEALMYGVPVISTKCGGPEDFVNDRVGVLIPVNDEKKLEEAIKYMINNISQYDKNHIKKYAEYLFAPTIIANQYINLYKRIISNYAK